MATDRKTMLIESELPIRPSQEIDPKRLREMADEGGLYMSLTNTPGWKKLTKEYIEPHISMNRLLIAKPDTLADERAGVKELVNLLDFIKHKVEDGMKAFEKLNQKEGG